MCTVMIFRKVKAHVQALYRVQVGRSLGNASGNCKCVGAFHSAISNKHQRTTDHNSTTRTQTHSDTPTPIHQCCLFARHAARSRCVDKRPSLRSPRGCMHLLRYAPRCMPANFCAILGLAAALLAWYLVDDSFGKRASVVSESSSCTKVVRSSTRPKPAGTILQCQTNPACCGINLVVNAVERTRHVSTTPAYTLSAHPFVRGSVAEWYGRTGWVGER